MKAVQFDFDLPTRFIAQRPAHPRDAARLLVVDSDSLTDANVHDLPGLLRHGDLLVCNDTRVLAARLRGTRKADRGTAAVEVTLNRALAPDTWSAFARPAKRLRGGDAIEFQGGLTATVEAKGEGGEVTLRFSASGPELLAAIEAGGKTPLPPYMGRDPDEADLTDYQTVFADRLGAVAAPTAGLHFTPDLLDRLSQAGIGLVRVTLHVGAGTFLPVKAEDTDDHVMHSEWGEVSAEAASAINSARDAGRRIVAVGTTALRLLESAVDEAGRAQAFAGNTNLFITPGYKFRAVDLLMTNFHLPRSTLFMLVCAVAGTERMKSAYEHAKAAGYRFYSYGDCCLLKVP